MSTNLQDIVSFFDAQSSSNDVTGALGSASVAFKIAMFFIMFVGAIAMAIFIGRIAIDIAVIVTRGTGIDSKISKFGTGGGESATSVGDYVKKNLPEIVFVIILIVFLISGYLFRLIAMALSGFGALGNKLFGLDLGGSFSELTSDGYRTGIQTMRPGPVKNEYDRNVGQARAELQAISEISKKGGADVTSRHYEKYRKAVQSYAASLAKAEVAGEAAKEHIKQYRVPDDYFTVHTKTTGDGVCNSTILESEEAQAVITGFESGVSCTSAGQ